MTESKLQKLFGRGQPNSISSNSYVPKNSHQFSRQKKTIFNRFGFKDKKVKEFQPATRRFGIRVMQDTRPERPKEQKNVFSRLYAQRERTQQMSSEEREMEEAEEKKKENQ